MLLIKTTTRIAIWSFVAISILVAVFLFFFGDINKLKNTVEENLKNQLTCTVKLGKLDWDWNGLRLGVTTDEISLNDKDGNLVLQAGPTRFVWHIKNLITGTYSHFYTIESANLYLNAIHYKDNTWNLIKMFPPGPPPKVDNLELHNSIIYLIDELNPTSKAVLYKDFNILWGKKIFSNIRRIDLTTRIGSLTGPSFSRIKGRYTESRKFNWQKNIINLTIFAKKTDLSNWQNYIANLVKEPRINKIGGEFTGLIRIKKDKNQKEINIRSISNTNNLLAEIQNEEATQTIEIPKTNFTLKAVIDPKKINLITFKSTIDELTYSLSGDIYNWSKPLQEINLQLTTNKFNFKSVKPYLPISLLPANTRARIEPINDDGLVQVDLKLQGPLIAPKYYGTILLDNFNLTSESGFLSTIQGLSGKLVLDDQILKIETLTIPIEGSPLVLKGEVNNEELKTNFNLNGKDLDIHLLKDLLIQIGFQSAFLSELETNGKLGLNLDVTSTKDIPEIKGKITFNDVSLLLEKDKSVEIEKVIGELILTGSKVVLNKVSGLINNEYFSINGDFSLKEDESINLHLIAEHLKIIPYVLSFIARKTPFKPVAETISGEASNLDLSINGKFLKPSLNGKLEINNVSFSLPNLASKISNIVGKLRFEGDELVIEELNGKVQDSDFSIAGYLGELFTSPKPKLRLVTSDIEISSFWNYLKESLKTASLRAQANEVEELKGIAALDIFIHPNVVLGNIFFKDGKVKYKPLPFSLNNLNGRVVIGEKNLSIFSLNGKVDESNNFYSDLTIYNYLDPSFYIEGRVNLDLDLSSLVNSLNAKELNTITVNGLIPTTLNFGIKPPITNLYFYSNLDEMLELELLPYIKKSTKWAHALSGNIEFDSKDMNLYLNDFNIMSNKLSLSTKGSIKNIASKEPEIMLYFNTDEPNGLYMIIEPIIPLMGFKAWGMIELNGSVTGTPSQYIVSSYATVTDLMLPDLLGKKLSAKDSVFSVYFDKEQGVINSMVNNLEYASLKADSVSLLATYVNPVTYLNELALDSPPGNIYANGFYDPRDGSVNFNANGSSIDLSSLGSFIFLDPSKLSGSTNFSIMIEGNGKTRNEQLRNSKGNLTFNVQDGKIGQVVLLQKGIQLANLFGQGLFGLNIKNVFSLFFKYKDGSFNTLKGELDINKGIVTAKELNYRAKDLYLNSYGFVDLVNSFVQLLFYGYIPEKKLQETEVHGIGALSINPEAIGKKRFFIPFIHSTPLQYFKFEVKGDIKKPKKITGHTRRSFKWLKGKKLKRELKYVPKAE